MKTNFIVLILIAFSCLNCTSDDDGGGNVELLTEDNYISESNFYKIYLESEIDELQIEIDSLQAIIDNNQGDATTQMNLDDATTLQVSFNAELADVVQKGNPIPLPPPPPPCPDSNSCFPIDALYLVSLSSINSLVVTIYDGQNNLLGSTSGEQLLNVPGYNSDFKYQSISLNQYSGPVTISVEKLDDQNNQIAYSIDGYAQ